MQEPIRRFRELVGGSQNIVFFGGAGVSTESGIPDFRSADGLYSQRHKYPPEVMLSRDFLEQNPEAFFRFHREKLVAAGARPNLAHLRLAAWEREGRLKAVITQNIDGLHQMAGSQNVLELHGSVHRARCNRCGRRHPADAVNFGAGVPRCVCGGVVRPDIVLYGEMLDGAVMEKAAGLLRGADVLLVGGTSLAVYPAAGLLGHYRGRKLVLINQSATPYDSEADLLIHEKIGEVFSQI